MRIYKISIFLLLLLILSCSPFISEEYKEVKYFTPKFIPFSQTVIILKNIHKYTETGSPGGTNTDLISSKWYLMKYNIDDGSYSETNIKDLDFNPFWIDKGITSVNDSILTIVTYHHVFLLNIHTNKLDTLPDPNDNTEILDAYCTTNNKNIIVLKGSPFYSIASFNILSRNFTDLVSLDGYYPDLAASNSIKNNFYILGNFSSENEITLVDANNKQARKIPYNAKYASVYDENKIAILQESGDILFLSVSSDTLIKENIITLDNENPYNFSVKNSLDFLVYEDWNSIILRDIKNRSEEVLFSDRRSEK